MKCKSNPDKTCEEDHNGNCYHCGNKLIEEDYYSMGTSLMKHHNDLSPITIEEFLETLEDMDLLNEKGKALRKDFWEEWIKED